MRDGDGARARWRGWCSVPFDPKTGAAGSVFDLLADPRHNHRVEVAGGVLAEIAGPMLSAYFRARRGKGGT